MFHLTDNAGNLQKQSVCCGTSFATTEEMEASNGCFRATPVPSQSFPFMHLLIWLVIYVIKWTVDCVMLFLFHAMPGQLQGGRSESSFWEYNRAYSCAVMMGSQSGYIIVRSWRWALHISPITNYVFCLFFLTSTGSNFKYFSFPTFMILDCKSACHGFTPVFPEVPSKVLLCSGVSGEI